jgi:ubiquinone/menaquinone biosynthesis C-methylase UbiE
MALIGIYQRRLGAGNCVARSQIAHYRFSNSIVRKGTAMTTQEVEQTRTAWDKIAAGFDEFTTPLSMPVAAAALRRVGLAPGMRFLDVAAGSGAFSIPAAQLGAHVVATDISPVMIERLMARARLAGLSNLQGRVMDGHNLELEDNIFDVTASQNGVSIFPDMLRGLREMVRVTRPGGKILVVAFGAPTRVEFLTFFLAAVRVVVPQFDGLPSDPPPLPFQASDPNVLHGRMAEAGARDIRIETTSWNTEFHSAQHLWDVVTSSNPIAVQLVNHLSNQQREEVRHTLAVMLNERSGGRSTASLSNEMNVATGTK